MSVPCDLFKALLRDLENNPQEPMLAALDPAERVALRAHVRACEACLEELDNVEYPEDDDLTGDMGNEIVGFLAGDEDEPADEETEAVIAANPGLKPGKWGMTLEVDAWDLRVARQALRLYPRDYERQLSVTARLISRGEADRDALPNAAIRLAWVREAVRHDPRYLGRRER